MSREMSSGNIILASGKKGILKPDANGYYTVNAGGFNIPNRWGITYTMNRYLLDCIENPESDLQRRLKRKEVYAEAGHPTMWYYEKINGQVVQTRITQVFEWVSRLKTMLHDRWCGHIDDFKYDLVDFNRNTLQGKVFFMVVIKPTGPFGPYLKENLDTPNMNTSFSIRTVTAPQAMGHTSRDVEYWSNVDWVPEPGMDKANKYNTAGLEGMFDINNPNWVRDNEFQISRDEMIYAIEHEMKKVDAVERVGGMEAFIGFQDLLNILKQNSVGQPNRNVTLIQRRSPIDLF